MLEQRSNYVIADLELNMYFITHFLLYLMSSFAARIAAIVISSTHVALKRITRTRYVTKLATTFNTIVKLAVATFSLKNSVQVGSAQLIDIMQGSMMY